ncbi:MAG: response regulator, partial [Chitinophagaceae bacterium]
ENIAEILELAGYVVSMAENGKKGVDAALKQKPDLIICDIMMPELDGFGVLNIMQRNPDLKLIPFIFLTAKADAGDFRKGMGVGADDYITKPFSPTDLLHSIDVRLKKTAQLKLVSKGMEGVTQLIRITQGETALESFVEGKKIERYKRKQIIYSEGNHPIWLFYILKGKVKIFVSNTDGKELVVTLCRAGDFFGYSSLLEGSVYKDRAAALEDTELAVVSKQEFENLMRSNYEISQKFIKLLAKNITAKEQQLINLAYDSLRKKVADALIRLRDKFKENEDETFTIKISRENLASVAGTATESLIRTLTDFKNEKLIDIQSGSITILDSSKLKKMLN